MAVWDGEIVYKSGWRVKVWMDPKRYRAKIYREGRNMHRTRIVKTMHDRDRDRLVKRVDAWLETQDGENVQSPTRALR